ADHPLRPIRQMVNAALVKMDALFSGMYEADIKGEPPRVLRRLQSLRRWSPYEEIREVFPRSPRTRRSPGWRVSRQPSIAVGCH
ncbi:MAG: hypothetical protein CVV17_06645, partial [Gammaproteobacteria bacterium HGW-Gammaproteobacteria-7]